jgi:hypothetical protein
MKKSKFTEARSKMPRRNRAGAHHLERVSPSHLHECWSINFVSDQLFDGRKFRCLTIVDNYISILPWYLPRARHQRGASSDSTGEITAGF